MKPSKVHARRVRKPYERKGGGRTYGAYEGGCHRGNRAGVRTDAYTVAAKTGSAEFETGKETHAWFTGFAPAESPRLVVTVLVEEGGSGGEGGRPHSQTAL